MSIGNTSDLSSQYRNSWTYLLILLAGVLIAYWPLSFHVLSLKNDALNYFLPVRRLVSEAWHHQMMPLWSPYLNLGYPLYGDMQSGVWNPIVMLFSIFGPYNLYTLQLETVLYLYLAGAGMFFLLKYFKVHPYANLLVSFGYMLCGFGSGACQYLNWIAGISFLPFLFLFYYRCLHEKSFSTAIYTAFAFYLMFTCAYPADFIIAAYLMLAMFIWFVVQTYRGNKTFPFSLLRCHLVLVITFLFLSAPAILSYAQTLPLTERGYGASYEQVMSNPLHPTLVSSFVLPLSIGKMPTAEITDYLERNSYIGLVTFILLLASFLIKSSSKIMTFSKYATIIFLFFSFGEMGGLRVLAYYSLPLMDTFRHPANAKMFTLFFACLLAAFTFDAIIKDLVPKKQIKMAFVIAAIFTVVIFAWSLASPFEVLSPSHLAEIFNPAKGISIGDHLKQLQESMTFADFVLLNTLIQAPFFYLAWRWLITKPKPRRLLALAIANSLFFCLLAQPLYVVKNNRASNVQRLIDEHTVTGYPIPNLQSSLSQNSRDGMSHYDEIGVLTLYNKKPGRVEYIISPSNLISQSQFWSDSIRRSLILQYPLIYKADSALSLNTSPVTLSSGTGSKYVFVEDDGLKREINNLPAEYNAGITSALFHPGKFIFSIWSDKPGYYVLLQNHFPAWNLSIDGKPYEFNKVNRTFMGFRLPEGQHQVEFEFRPFGIVAAWCLSILTALFIIVYAAFSMIRKQRSRSHA